MLTRKYTTKPLKTAVGERRIIDAAPYPLCVSFSTRTLLISPSLITIDDPSNDDVFSVSVHLYAHNYLSGKRETREISINNDDNRGTQSRDHAF